MTTYTVVSGIWILIRNMVMVYRYGLMGLSIKVLGIMIKHMEREGLYWLMVMCMKDIGRMIKHTDKALITTLMELYTQETGHMTSFTVLDARNGQMIHHITEITKTVPKMAKAHSNGVMAQSTWDNGEIIKCTVMEHLIGKTAGSTKDLIRMTKRMVMER